MNKQKIIFLQFFHEYATFNPEQIRNGKVVAIGTITGDYYAVTLDNDFHVIKAEQL